MSGLYFPAFGLNTDLSVFSPNAGKYGPEITPYLDTFHVVLSPSINQSTKLEINVNLSTSESLEVMFSILLK